MIVIFLDIANTCMYIILQKIRKKITVDKIKLTLIFMHTLLYTYRNVVSSIASYMHMHTGYLSSCIAIIYYKYYYTKPTLL